MKKNAFYKKNKDIYSAELDNEVCLFNPNFAEYLTLNETASLIWNALDEEKTLEGIIKYLNKIYNIDLDNCFIEVNEFLSEMIRLKLVIVSPK
tara:strand:+ start:44 stop:322 length:279 start_codon:yes stop_codon:yes gene_type:complete